MPQILWHFLVGIIALEFTLANEGNNVDEKIDIVYVMFMYVKCINI